MGRRRFGVLAAGQSSAALVVANLFASAGGGQAAASREVRQRHRSGPARQRPGDTPGEGPPDGCEAYLLGRAHVSGERHPAGDRERGRGRVRGDRRRRTRRRATRAARIASGSSSARSGARPSPASPPSPARRTTRRAASPRSSSSPDCSAGEAGLPRLGRRLGRRRLAHRQRAGRRTRTGSSSSPDQLDQNSVGALTLDPTDKKDNTLYLGTGEGTAARPAARPASASTSRPNGGNNWTKLADTCVSNATYTCATPGKDAFLGRGINAIVVDPRNANHIFVGSAQAVRGLSHVIGNGGTTRLEPGANEPGLYESTDGGATFTEVWNGNKPDAARLRRHRRRARPAQPDVVYASAFDAGRSGGVTPVRRRRRSARSSRRSSTRARGIDRTMFALTVEERAHADLPDRGHAANGGGVAGAAGVELLADRQRRTSRPRRCSPRRRRRATPPIRRRTRSRRRTPAGRSLTSKTTGDPYFATDDFCTRPVLVRRGRLHAGRAARHGVRDRLEPVRRAAVQHERRRLRQRPLERPRGALLDHRGRSRTAGDRHATCGRSPTCRTTRQITTAPWCAYAPYFDNGCVQRAERDPSRPARDRGQPRQPDPDLRGLGRRDDPHERDVRRRLVAVRRRRSATAAAPLPPTSGSYTACKRLLSRVPTRSSTSTRS